MIKYIATILLFSLMSCSNENISTLHISLDNLNTDQLFVRNFIPTSGILDTISVVNGKATYEFVSEIPEAYYIFNKNNSIGVNFVSNPGEYFANWENNNYSISGESNIYLKEMYENVGSLVSSQRALYGDLKNRTEIDSIETAEKLNIVFQKLTGVFSKAVTDNRSNIISALSTYYGSIVVPEEYFHFDSLYNMIDQKILSNTKLGEILVDEYELRKASKSLPMDVPAIKVIGVDNSILYFNEINTTKKYVYINLWASWCIPCREKLPELLKLYGEYSSEIDFVSISKDSDTDSWLKAVQEDVVPWEQLIISNREDNSILDKHWGVRTIPHGIVINNEFKTIKNRIQKIEELDLALKNLFE